MISAVLTYPGPTAITPGRRWTGCGVSWSSGCRWSRSWRSER